MKNRQNHEEKEQHAVSKDYEVGFGKTPKHTRFKKGRSGNPKGRARGSKNMRTIMNEALNRPVTITENGRKRQVKFSEAFIRQMIAKGVNGSTNDQLRLLRAFNEFAPDQLREMESPQVITVTFVDAKDGRPAPLEADGAVSDSAEPSESPSSADTPSGNSDDEDDSWLD